MKQTSEPPKGVKQNMNRLYSNMDAKKFENLKLVNKSYYKKLVFALCWLHSIIIERKRFKNMGWNTLYDFNDSDWETADYILQLYIDKQAVTLDKPGQASGQQPPQPTLGLGQDPTAGSQQAQQKSTIAWDAIKYLISDITYGGRVTDEWDRRLLQVYANEYFSDKTILEEKHKLAPHDVRYVVPDELTLKEAKNQEKGFSEPMYYQLKIQEFPAVETPETFGQFINAEIQSQIIQTDILINSIISLSPKTLIGGEVSQVNSVFNMINELLQKIPEQLNYEEIYQKIKPQEDNNPLKIVLLQEILRYNKLIALVRQSLMDLSKGIQGLVLISEELEKVQNSLFELKVPAAWSYCYYSLKPLYSWVDDLVRRIDQLKTWAEKGQPNEFWISGFSFPTGFTTALMQQMARKQRVAIDAFTWEFNFLDKEQHITAPAKDGAFVTGLFLEGAKW